MSVSKGGVKLKVSIRLFLILTFSHFSSSYSFGQNCSEYAFAANRRATVWLHVEKSDTQTGALSSENGTGFIVSPSGYVLTANHILLLDQNQNVQRIIGRIASRNGAGRYLDVIEQDQNADVALLKFRDSSQEYFTVMFGPTNIPLGTAWCSGGFPGSEDYHITSGTLSSTYIALWTTNMESNPGDSGSPVFLYSGEVVAMKSAGFDQATRRNLVTPISAAQRVLARVPDREEPCEIVGENPPFRIAPHNDVLKIDGADVGHRPGAQPTAPVIFSCGSSVHIFELIINWDLSSMGQPNFSDHCQFSLKTDPGMKYKFRLHSIPTGPGGSMMIDQCTLIPSNQPIALGGGLPSNDKKDSSVEQEFHQFLVGRWSAHQVVAQTGYQYNSIIEFTQNGAFTENDYGNPPVALAGSWKIVPLSSDTASLTITLPVGTWTYTLRKLNQNTFKNEVVGYTAYRVSN